MPPRIMFRGKLRPGQFEFPCCEPCNRATRDTDLVLAWIGRIYPNPTAEADRSDVQKILRGLSNNMPEVLHEMQVGTAGQKLARKRTKDFKDEQGGVLRISGPKVSRHLDVFGCKLALAMYWEATKQIIPLAGGVVVRVYSNVEAIEGKLPNELIKLMPRPQTLRQGSWGVADQFQFSSRFTDDQQVGAFFASFRLSFAVAAIAALDRSFFNGKLGPIFSPAELWKAP